MIAELSDRYPPDTGLSGTHNNSDTPLMRTAYIATWRYLAAAEGVTATSFAQGLTFAAVVAGVVAGAELDGAAAVSLFQGLGVAEALAAGLAAALASVLAVAAASGALAPPQPPSESAVATIPAKMIERFKAASFPNRPPPPLALMQGRSRPRSGRPNSRYEPPGIGPIAAAGIWPRHVRPAHPAWRFPNAFLAAMGTA